MAVKTPHVIEIAPDTYAINDYGLSAMFLVVGEDFAVLIDSGCGTCNPKEICSKITDKPIKLYLTHGHLDHVGGAGYFEEMWINDEDVEMAQSLNYESLRNYCDMLGKMGAYDAYDYSTDFIKELPMPINHPIHDGDIIDLGGRTLEAIHVPGHTKGSMSFLDRKNRILFSGDCCNVNLLCLAGSVKELYEGLLHLNKFTGTYDQNFNGHIGYAGSPYVFSQPKTILQDQMNLCQMIIDGKAEVEERQFLGKTTYGSRYNTAFLQYDPNNIK